MANVNLTVDFTRWPEVIYAIRSQLVEAIRLEAQDAEPAVAESLMRVAAKFDAGLTDIAEMHPDGDKDQ